MPLEEGEAPGATPGSTRRVKIRDVNAHLACVLCSGYLVDATTIIECMHSFCRTCIVRYLETSKFCPICDVLVHKTKPLMHVRPDKMLQALVYKIVPGLFHSEVRKRREFWAKTREPGVGSGGVGAALTPEEEAEEEEEEREEVAAGAGGGSFFSAEDSISLSLEYYDSERAAAEDEDDEDEEEDEELPEAEESKVEGDGRRRRRAIRSGASDGECVDQSKVTRRYLKCPAAVTMLHLKKFIRMKYGLSDENRVDVIYKDECLPDEFSLMDVAYTFSWRRKRPMRFSYRIFKKPKPPVRRRILRSITTNGPRSIMSSENGAGDGSSEGDSVMKTPPPEEEARNGEQAKLEEGRMEEEEEGVEAKGDEEEEEQEAKVEKEAKREEEVAKRVEEKAKVEGEAKREAVVVARREAVVARRTRAEEAARREPVEVNKRVMRERTEASRDKSRLYLEDDDDEEDEVEVMPVGRRGRKSRREDRRGKAKGRGRGEERGRRRKVKRAKSREELDEDWEEERPRKRPRVEVVQKAVREVVEEEEAEEEEEKNVEVEEAEEVESAAPVAVETTEQQEPPEEKEPQVETVEVKEMKVDEEVPTEPDAAPQPVAEEVSQSEVPEEKEAVEVKAVDGPPLEDPSVEERSAEDQTEEVASSVSRSPGSTIKSKDDSASSPESSFRLVLEEEDEDMELLILEDSMEDKGDGTCKEDDDIEEEEVDEENEEELKVEEECEIVEGTQKAEEPPKPSSPPPQPTPPPTPEKAEESREEEEMQAAKEEKATEEIVKDTPIVPRKPPAVSVASAGLKTTLSTAKQNAPLITKVSLMQKPQVQVNKNVTMLSQNPKSPPPHVAKLNPVQVKVNNINTKTIHPQVVASGQTTTAQPKQPPTLGSKTVSTANKTVVSAVSKANSLPTNKNTQPPNKAVVVTKVTPAGNTKNTPSVTKQVISSGKPAVSNPSKTLAQNVPKPVASQQQPVKNSVSAGGTTVKPTQPSPNMKASPQNQTSVKMSQPSTVSKPVPALTNATKQSPQVNVSRPSPTPSTAAKVVNTTSMAKTGTTPNKSGITMVKIGNPSNTVKSQSSATSLNKSQTQQLNRSPTTAKGNQGQNNSQKPPSSTPGNSTERPVSVSQSTPNKSITVTPIKGTASGVTPAPVPKVTTSGTSVTKTSPSQLPKTSPVGASLPKGTTVTPAPPKSSSSSVQGTQQPRSTPPMPGLAAIKRKLPEGTTVRRSSRDSSTEKKDESQEIQPPPVKKKKKASKGDKVNKGNFPTFPVSFKRVANLQPPAMLTKPRVNKVASPSGDDVAIIHDDYGALDLSGRSSRKSESPPATSPTSTSPSSSAPAPVASSSSSPSHKPATPTPPPPPPSPSKSPKAPQSQHSILSIAQTLVNRQLSSSRGAGGKSPARDTPTPPLPPKTPPRAAPTSKPSTTSAAHQGSSSPSPTSPRQQQQTPPAAAMSNLMTLTDTAVKILMAERTAATGGRLPSPTPANQQSSSSGNPPPAHPPRPSGAPIRSTNPSLMSPLRIPVPPVSHHQYHQHQPAPPRNQRPLPPHSSSTGPQTSSQPPENGDITPHLPRGLTAAPIQNGRGSGGFRSRGANPMMRMHGMYSGGKPGPNQGVRQIPNPSLLTQPQNRMQGGMGRGGQGEHMHHPQLSIQPTSLHHQFQHQLQQQRRGGGYGGGPKPPYVPPGAGRGPPHPHGPPGMPPSSIRNIEHLTRSIEKVAAGLSVRAVESRAK